MNKMKMILLLAATLGGGLLVAAAGLWILLTPQNWLLQQFRGPIADTGTGVVIGPYPLEDDLTLLKSQGVGLVVSLLDPQLPYERILLERETRLAEKIGLRIQSFPMSSVLGRRFGSHTQDNARLAAEAVLAEKSRVYMHCYLGVHRVKDVEAIIRQRGGATARYKIRKGQRSSGMQHLDQAQAHYEAGRYADALTALDEISSLEAPGQLLKAWSLYHLNRTEEARKIFSTVIKESPDTLDAIDGLGYCALRAGNREEARGHFESVLRVHSDDPGALEGLKLLKSRK